MKWRDKDGYPTDEALERIRGWPATLARNRVELLEFVHSLWWHPELVKRFGGQWSFSTGGWSGNEDLIWAMEDNAVFWALAWHSSYSGGRHVFEPDRPGEV